MTKEQQNINWLLIAFEQPEGLFQEIFYFDKRDNQFFSILITDYFLFDENLNFASDVTSNYPADVLSLLKDKIVRIHQKDPNIISVPRLGKLKIGITSFQHEQAFLDLHNIDISTATIWEVDLNTEINIVIDAK